MYYRRPLPVASSVYRPLDVSRYVVTTAGGFWPVIQSLPDGRLGVVTRDGDFHIGERGRLVFVTSPDGGESWSHDSVISADGPDNRDPAFGVAPDGTLVACFIKWDLYGEEVQDPAKGRGKSTPLYITRSTDGGETWSRGELMHEQGHEEWSGAQDTGPDTPNRFYSAFGKILTLSDGTMLMGYHVHQFEPPGHAAAFVVRSSDNGRTWTDQSNIAKDFLETALCDLGDGHLIAVMRSNALWQSDSYDGGYTWSDPHQVTDDMEFPGDILRLQDGRLLLTYGRRVPPYGVQGMVSRDEGKTWDRDHKIFLVGDCSSTDCGYPSSLQREDGAIVTVYYAWDTVAEHEQMRGIGVHGAALIYRPEDLG